MNSTNKHIGFEVFEENGEKVIKYTPSSFSIWLHIPVLFSLLIVGSYNWLISSFIAIIWIIFTIRTKQKNEIFIEQNKISIGNDSINITQIKGFTLCNAFSEEKLKVSFSDVIKKDATNTSLEIDAFISSHKHQNAFQINMVIENNEKKLAWNLKALQAKSLLTYFSQGQYLINQE